MHGVDLRLRALPVVRQVCAAVAVDLVDPRLGDLLDLALAVGAEDHRGSGDEQVAVVVALLAHELQERQLAGEDVGGVVVEVVDGEQAVALVQEAGRAGEGEHLLGAVLLDVAQRARHAVLALAAADGGLHAVREVVDHRVPDGAGVLQEVRVVRTERGDRAVLDRPGVVLVEDPNLAVVDRDTAVAERAVGRGDQRVDEDPQAAREFGDLPVAGLHEVPEAQLLQLLAQVRHLVVGSRTVVSFDMCRAASAGRSGRGAGGRRRGTRRPGSRPDRPGIRKRSCPGRGTRTRSTPG